MSGRLAQFTAPHPSTPPDWQPDWNLAPGARVLILRKQQGRLDAATVLWNLTPGWLKDLSRASFNARAELLHEKPMFKQALAQRRCLIPVNGYYLWKSNGTRKHPWYLRRREGGLALAGIWERYQLDDGQYWDSCALITVPAKGLPAKLAERMPVTFNSGEQAIWLAEATPVAALQPLLLNAEAQVEMIHPVATAVSSPATKGPHCCNPSGPIQTLN
ncbi:MAG: SOS response-associated peptidase [Halopseudomonas sp.]|uniref:SOS response-associated peptidase n=1 Tax=Halopseudomonas sp. TaxID=2901191 RepID=UPI003001C3F2